MHIIFGVAAIIIAITIPFWLCVILLILLRRKVDITFNIDSVYSISNVKVIYESDICKFYIYIQNIHLGIQCYRIRFFFVKISSSLTLLNDYNYVLNENLKSNQARKKNNNHHKHHSTLKQKFSKLLHQLFEEKNTSGNKLIKNDDTEIENINSILKLKKLSLQDRVLLFALNFFDVYSSEINFNIKFTSSPFYHSLIIRKSILGFVNSPNKTNEIDFIGAFYDIEIFEYNTSIKSQYSKLNKIFNIQSNNDDKYIKNRLFYLPETILNVKIDDGLFRTTSVNSLFNSITINIESRALVSNLSTLSIKSILSFILSIIRLNLSQKNKTKGSSTAVVIEQLIIQKLNSTIKKFSIRIKDVNISIYSDNFLFKHLVVQSKEVDVANNINLFDGIDSEGNLNLFSSKVEIKLISLTVSQFKRNQLLPICTVPVYSITKLDSLVYVPKTLSAVSSTTILSSLMNVDAALTSQNLDKIIDIVITIIDGIDDIEHEFKNHYISKIILPSDLSKEFIDKTKIEFDFININAILYNSSLMFYARDVTLKLTMDKVKGIKDIIELHFSPLNVSFTHNENNYKINNYYVGNALVNKFYLSIVDTKLTRNILLTFNETFAIAHDFHLMLIMKFISEIIGSIFEMDLVKKYMSSKKKKRKTDIKLIFVDTEVCNYLNKEDVVYGVLKNFEICVDSHLSIPHFSAMYSTTDYYHFTHFCELDNFYIDLSEKDEVKLLFEDIYVNAYSPIISRPIFHYSTFYTFFPNWLEYYFTSQFLIDEKTKIEKFKIERTRKTHVLLTFVKINIDINDTEVSKCGILQADYDELKSLKEENNPAKIIKYLKDVKKNLLNVQVSGFTIETDNDKKVKENTDKNRNKGYYVDVITRTGSVKLKFGEIKALLEQYELLSLKNFRIECFDDLESKNFDPDEKRTILTLYGKYNLIQYKAKCESKKYSLCEIFINDLKFGFEDVKVFDKTLNYTFKCVKVIANLPFAEFDSRTLTDTKYANYTSEFNLYVNNLDGAITSVDPITKEAYNKLDIKIAIFALSTKFKTLLKTVLCNTSELSLHYFIFGFDPSQKTGFPLLIMPLAEANFDKLKNIIRLNIPTEISNKSSYSRLFNEIYTQQLNELVMETKSLTVFINFKYLSTFFKIFEVFWEKTKALRNSVGRKSKKEKEDKKAKKFSSGKSTTTVVPTQKFDSNSSNGAMTNQKLMLSLFDLKLIYLLEYKKEHENYFIFHPFVKEHMYFGYIFRLYSFSFKYELTPSFDSFYSSMNLLTISFLDDDNFSDEDFFVHDREIQTTEFFNLKKIENFNSFMEFSKENTMKLINSNLKNYFAEFEKKNTDEEEVKAVSKKYNDLKFDYRHTFAKISNVFLNSKINLLSEDKDLSIVVDNLKLTWNKFNKDVLMLLLFEDVLLIVDRIILKIDVKKEKKDSVENSIINLSETKSYVKSKSLNQNYTNFPSGKFNFVFEIKNPQICIQNEIKKSTLLLMSKKPIKVSISKFSLNDNVKDFNLEFLCDYLALYSAPKCVSNEYIHWIGRGTDNKYYLSETLFGQILLTPKIRFNIIQQVESCDNDEFHVKTQMKIDVDKIKGDFESSYFTDFMNIVEVFLFDRGYSFAEEKNYMDSKRKDMQTFKKSELEFSIKNSVQPQGKNPLQKEISFYLGEVVFNLCKGGKTLMQFLLINFDGNHEIFSDKSSETHINVRNFHIKNAENNRNDLIFSPLYSERLGDFEDKINIVTFTKKDRYISIGTDSLWYVIDYLEFNIRPVIMNISKAQIEFILDFFFQEQPIPDQEEQAKVNMQGSSTNVVKANKKKEEKDAPNSKQENTRNNEDDEPIYFKHFKVNETEVLLNFEYGEAHPLNIPKTKLKFGMFDKQEKFYPMNAMLNRFVSHCKKQCIKNLGAIISGLFSSSDNITFERKRKENDEENHRKLLFGNK